jgi:hypothetical protein
MAHPKPSTGEPPFQVKGKLFSAQTLSSMTTRIFIALLSDTPFLAADY